MGDGDGRSVRPIRDGRMTQKEFMAVLASALATAEERTPSGSLGTLAEVRVCIASAMHAAGLDQMDFWEALRAEEIRRANA